MAKSWIIDGKAIAKKVINASVFPAKQLKDCGAKRQCPRCHCWIDNSDVSYQWPGLPAGVKFDPSDAQLLDHLAAKCGVGNGKPHVLIDDFIPTLDTDKGICYTHPKDLPGARKDGNHIHFFHKTANAYASGQRKRRKILSQQSVEAVRWHKTGKTKPVIENGVQKGYKKIMVLYRCSQKGSKPVKSNWAMHQYHLGTEEDEKEGEFVVSKIFYKKQKDTEKTNYCVLEEETGVMAIPCGPKTPKTSTPNPPRAGNSLLCDNVTDDSMPPFVTEGLRYADEGYPLPSTSTRSGVKDKYPGYLARESQAVDLDTNSIDDSLLCKEIFTTCAPLDECLARSISDTNGDSHKGSCGIADLENLELDTPPDFDLADLQFGSQDSILGWLDRW